MTRRRTYTVIGLWIDDEPIVAGVIRGTGKLVDENSGDEYQRWATSVLAADPLAAEAAAIDEMTGEDDEAGKPPSMQEADEWAAAEMVRRMREPPEPNEIEQD